MQKSTDPGAPERIAAAAAPIIDRLRLAVVGALRPVVSELAERTGVPGPALAPLGMLRNTMPDRVVAVADVLEVFLYQPPDVIRGALDALQVAGMLESPAPDMVRLAEAGRTTIGELFERTQTFLDELWAGHAELVVKLLPLAQRACGAVAETGGAASRVVAPPYVPAGASSAFVLGECLTPLRIHRFDAHAAAWRAEGLTAEQVQQLGPGAQRQRIEDETNRIAAAPYAVLTADERFTLCTGLGALPN